MSSRAHFTGVLVALVVGSLLAACGGEATSHAGVAAGASSVADAGSSGAATTGGGPSAGVGGANPGAGAAGSGGGGIIGCGSVVDDAPLITPVTLAGAPPTPVGGAILSGTYVLSSLTFYLSGATCTPPSLKTSAVFNVYADSSTSGAIEEDTNQNTTISTIKDSRDTLKYTVADSMLTLDYDCVGALSAFSRNAPSPMSFSATGSEIRAFGPNASCGVSVSVFTRR